MTRDALLAEITRNPTDAAQLALEWIEQYAQTAEDARVVAAAVLDAGEDR